MHVTSNTPGSEKDVTIRSCFRCCKAYHSLSQLEPRFSRFAWEALITFPALVNRRIETSLNDGNVYVAQLLPCCCRWTMTSATVDTWHIHFAQLLFWTDTWAGRPADDELGSVRLVPTTICWPLEPKEKAASECVIPTQGSKLFPSGSRQQQQKGLDRNVSRKKTPVC
jgi:hypothetical protein